LGYGIRASAGELTYALPVLWDLLQLLAGGVLLYFGAEWLVSGAAGLAARAGIRPMIVGLTVVSWGTSAPELVVSSLAALEGSPAIALGNVVGSNIANLGLILGLTAAISPPPVEGGLIRREVPILLLATAAIPLLLYDGWITRWEGGVLLLGAAGFSYWLVRSGVSTAGQEETDAEAELPESVRTPKRPAILAALTLVGMVGLVLGGRFFVMGSIGLALGLGMSERVVGLTVVAVGTSLPELATSLIAAMRGHSAIAVGNVVGSNIYNVVGVLGGAAAIHPLATQLSTMGMDIGVMVGLTLLAALCLRRARTMRRWEGFLLLAIYFGYLGVLVVLG
jgi:cation:H+ antiporter